MSTMASDYTLHIGGNKHGGGEVAVAAVRQEHDDVFALVDRLPGQLGRSPQSRSGGDACQNSFGPPQGPAHGESIRICYRDDLVDDANVQHGWDKSRADPL